jgi:hypothetical protein
MNKINLFQRRLKRALDLEHPTIARAFAAQGSSCGFMDGGCYDLARALNYWAREKGTYIGFWRSIPGGPPQVFDHALLALKINGEQWLIDGNGVNTPEQALRRTRALLSPLQNMLDSSLLKMSGNEFELYRGEPAAEHFLIVDALYQVLGKPCDYNIESPGTMIEIENFRGVMSDSLDRLGRLAQRPSL